MCIPSEKSERHALRVLLTANVALLVAVVPASIAGAQDAPVYYGYAPVGMPISAHTEMAYSDFLEQVQQGKVTSAVISGDRIRGELESGSRTFTINPETDNHATIEALSGTR